MDVAHLTRAGLDVNRPFPNFGRDRFGRLLGFSQDIQQVRTVGLNRFGLLLLVVDLKLFQVLHDNIKQQVLPQAD